MERWRKTFYNYYEVSSYGRVRRIVSGSPNTFPGRVLNPSKDSRYPLVVLYGPNGEKKTVRVHILVAEAFLGPCPLNEEVNHKDTNKWNPRLSNLEYVTPKKNGRHALLNGLNPGAKLTVETVLKLKKEAESLGYRKGMRGVIPMLSQEFSIKCEQVRNILWGRSWVGVE